MSRRARPTSLAVFLRLLALAAPFKNWMAVAVLFGSLTIGSSIGLMAASAFILASAARHPSVADLAVAVVAVRTFGIARGVFRYLERLVSHHVNFQLLARLRVWFYQAIEPLVPARWTEARSGDWLSRFVGDIETLQNFYVRVLAPPLVALVIAVCMSLYLSAFEPALAGVVLGFMFLAGILLPAFVWKAGAPASRALVDLRAALSVQWVDAIQGIADLIAFGRERAQVAQMNALSREWVRVQARMASLTGLDNALGNLLANAAMWSVLWLAIPLVRTARLDGVYLPVLALAVLASFEGVLALPLAFQYLESNLQAARRLFKVEDTTIVLSLRAPKERIGRTASPQSPAKASRINIGDCFGTQSAPRNDNIGIRFENVKFRYGADEQKALDGVSFQVRPGARVAIVGPSGAGKSTLINLLLRFWDNYEGRILLGDLDLRQYAPGQARRLFGVVSQSTYLFNASIRQNLLLACPGATEEEMVSAAQQARVDTFVSSLPAGYDTLIGEQGLQLSGGERQRLAIARALLQNAPVLLLDEPTANLDPITECQVLDALKDARERSAGPRTIIMLTHRLAGLESMDEILVLCGGRVVERGAHADLMQLNGVYRRMWEIERNQIKMRI